MVFMDRFLNLALNGFSDGYHDFDYRALAGTRVYFEISTNRFGPFPHPCQAPLPKHVLLSVQTKADSLIPDG
jgi:hypothetical protein